MAMRQDQQGYLASGLFRPKANRQFRLRGRNPLAIILIPLGLMVLGLGPGCDTKNKKASTVARADATQGVNPAITSITSTPATDVGVSGSPPAAGATREVRIKLTAKIDGSEQVSFSKNAVDWLHKYAQPPSAVVFNGEPWTSLGLSPFGWAELARDLDLQKARIVQRMGRDVIALEHTAAGFDLHFADCHNGGDLYEVTIAIPRR